MHLVFLNYLYIILFSIIEDSLEIQNVQLIVPSIVQAGASATLLCLYDLEGASLYSVQWYRGQFEFFRYVPNENPPSKIFRIPGLFIDELASNEHQVTLRNIPVHISGEFSCEVTTDAPPFSTSCVTNNLTVIDFRLELKAPKRQFKFAEIITATCILTPYLSSTKLLFHWNNVLVPDAYVRQKFNAIHLQVNTTFFDINKTSITTIQLTCSVLLNDTYYVTSKSIFLELWPVNYRSNGSNSKFTILWFIIIFLIINNN